MVDRQRDVLVVGSGGSALVAALAAHAAGAHVEVLEKSDQVGGTTAISGGLLWIPCNHHMLEAGHEDSTEDAITYCRVLAAGRSDDELIEAVVETGPEMIRFLEAETTLRFETIDKADYHPELPGARRNWRSLGPNIFDVHELGDRRDDLRGGLMFSLPLNWSEFDEHKAAVHPDRLDVEVIGQRIAGGQVGMGMALVGRMFKACLERGIPVTTGARARELLVEDGRVVGVRVERAGGGVEERRADAVVLACGGFEWNPELVRRFVAGPMTHPCSCSTNEGDGLVMAMAAGADLGNMWDLLRFPASNVAGETYDGRQLNRLVHAERAMPHAMMVNRRGRRFVNEAHNYTDVAKVFMHWDPVAYEFPNVPAWAVFDQAYRDTYSVLTVLPSDPTPEWLAQADSVEELASRVGIDPSGLQETVARYNGFVAEGHDEDFGRGRSWYDTAYGDEELGEHASLGTIEKPPFYALPVYPGAIGSSGGPRTNADGQVRHVTGGVIPGLYAAGDAAASAIGPGYGGAGGPIGQGMTMGFRAGRAAARG